MVKTFKVTAGDISFDESGAPVMVTGEQKLRQDIIECLLVGRKKNGYGAGLSDMIGEIGESIPAEIVFRVVSALEKYQALQAKQPYLSPEETLYAVYGVSAERVRGSSRTDYAFVLTIRNGKGPKPVKLCILRRPVTLKA
jgi:hypothetical protein